MIVAYGHEFYLQTVSVVCQDGVPHICRPIVFRPPKHPDIDEVLLLRKFALPFDTGVSGEHYIGLGLISQRVEELGRGGAFPQKFVHLARATVAQQQAMRAEFEASRFWEGAHPGAVVGIGVAESVVVANLGEMVVARVGVAALAIVEFVADRVVVVALNADDIVVAQQFKAAIRVGAKAAEITQAVNVINATLARVVERGRQGEVIAINPAEAGDAVRGAVGGGHRGIVRESEGGSRLVCLQSEECPMPNEQ